jgi:hypothetical protein
MMKLSVTRFSVPLTLIVLIAFSSCKEETALRPQMLGARVLSLPLAGVQFKGSGKDWKATLFTFTQPIQLDVQHTHVGFVISQQTDFGSIEGPAHLVLESGKERFYYEVHLVNRQILNREIKDYRSPKTVNPDSSLTHQQIFFELDRWRNITYSDGEKNLFTEKEIALTSRTGTYRAQEEEPITAYYIQPGSCVALHPSASLIKDKKIFKVKVGPLKDPYQNLVADGTVITFIYYDAQSTYQTEASLLNGIASIEIPIEGIKAYTLFAKVGNVVSDEIQLKSE